MGFRAGLWPDPLLSGVAGQGEGRERTAAGTSATGGRAPLPTPASPHQQAGTLLDPTQLHPQRPQKLPEKHRAPLVQDCQWAQRRSGLQT